MPTKIGPVNFRWKNDPLLGPAFEARLDDETSGAEVNERARDMLGRYAVLMKRELAGLTFTRAEVMAMLDAVNGWFVTPDSVPYLHVEVEDALDSGLAQKWGVEHPWLVGCNFSPSSAINQLEMWQAASFDRAGIDRELGWAESLGFNSLRVFLHSLAWQQDPQGFFSWVLKPDHTAGQRRLTLAGQQGQQFAVEKGLQAGEQVITDGAQRLREGAAVQVLN